jgi:hypothetical protein
MLVLDPPQLRSEGLQIPEPGKGRLRKLILWTCLVLGSGGGIVFVALHIVPAAGAAGGCGGG